MGHIFPTNPPGEGFVQVRRVVRNSYLAAEFVLSTADDEPPEIQERCAVQQRVLEKMGWTGEEYFEIVRLLINRKDVDVEILDPAEREAYFEIYYGLATAFKRAVPPAQFGFLGGRTRKIPPEKHSQVREEVEQLLSKKIPKSEAYAIVGRHWNNASAATVKRICEDRIKSASSNATG